MPRSCSLVLHGVQGVFMGIREKYAHMHLPCQLMSVLISINRAILAKSTFTVSALNHIDTFVSKTVEVDGCFDLVGVSLVRLDVANHYHKDSKEMLLLSEGI